MANVTNGSIVLATEATTTMTIDATGSAREAGTGNGIGVGREAENGLDVPGPEAVTATAVHSEEALTSNELRRPNLKSGLCTTARLRISPALDASSLLKGFGEKLKALFTSRSFGRKEE